MDKVLKWKRHATAAGCWIAEPKTGRYLAFNDGYWFSGMPNRKRAPSLAAAMDACEADYIARCSEFLRVAGPGECVVNAQYLRSLVDATCKDTCQAYESTQECETCWVELLRRDATAAIDAAGGGE